MRAKINIALFWLSLLLFFTLASYQVEWVIAGLAWAWLVFVIGLQIGAHRYFTHSSFVANRFQAGVMNVMAILGGMGTPQDWMVAHIAHHKYADTDKDPTNWRVIGLWKNYSSLWQLNVPILPHSVKLVVRSLKDPFALFLHNNYVFVLTGWGFLLLALSVKAFTWLFLLPIIVGHLGMNLLNHIGHLGDGQERKTSTSWFFNIITPGDGYHDFHHQNPRQYRFGRFDLLALLIDLFLKSKLKEYDGRSNPQGNL